MSVSSPAPGHVLSGASSDIGAAIARKLADSGRIVRMHGCPKCGYKVWNEPLSAPHLLVMKAGNLDDMSWAQPIGSIWTASKAP